MMKIVSLTACGLLSAAASLGCLAQETSPAGLWKSIDDATGKPAAMIRIRQANGEFTAQIETLLRPHADDPNPTCERCPGSRKGQPVAGLVILSGMRRQGATYSGGEILDPENGKTYRCNMTLSPDGSRLEVRGYIGAPLFGRTQIWTRVP